MKPEVEIAYTPLGVDPDAGIHAGSSRRVWRSGWRGTVALGSATAGVVLLVNLGVLIWTATRFELQHGVAIVFQGSCQTVKQISTWTHLAINVLSSLLLAASNSGMQVLCAPTREEVDRIHERRQWLDVGVHTLRNLASIDGRRLFLWMLLAFSSVPLHLVYNSVIFEISNGSGFNVYTVGKDFETGGFWNQTRAQCFSSDLNVDVITAMQSSSEGLVRLDNAACISAFGSGIQSSFGNVLAVSSETAPDNMLNVVTVYSGGGVGNNWVCDVAGRGTEYCDLSALRANAAGWTLPGIRSAASDYNYTSYDDYKYCSGPTAPNTNFPISYCLAQPAQQHCKLGISVVFLAIVVACNITKMLSLAISAWKLHFDPLVTVGDAVASFLDRPDATTEGYCLLGRNGLERWTSKKMEPIVWKLKSRSGFSAASGLRWFVCSMLYVSKAYMQLLTVQAAYADLVHRFVGFWALALGLLFEGISTLRSSGLPTNFSYLRGLGIGKPLVNNILNLGSSSDLSLSKLPADVFVANTPQLLISMLYLLYNDLFTRMQLAREWLSYGQTRKALRVTNPSGEQRSTRFLQLPFFYTVPLVVVMIILHWLVSQSIFLALINLYDYSQGLPPKDEGLSISGLGWSPYGIMLSLVVGGAMIVALWLYAVLLRYPKNMPLAGSCSAAISAACHKSAGDVDAARKQVKWGVIGLDQATNIGHAGFSTGSTLR